MMEENLVRFIVENLVSYPDQVTIEQRQAGKSVIIQLHVAQEDMGRVIGRNGRVANAIRNLLRAAFEDRQGQRVILEID
jgi:predicted RNA-binding protein YlqC (UPF0109 family)